MNNFGYLLRYQTDKEVLYYNGFWWEGEIFRARRFQTQEEAERVGLRILEAQDIAAEIVEIPI